MYYRHLRLVCPSRCQEIASLTVPHACIPRPHIKLHVPPATNPSFDLVTSKWRHVPPASGSEPPTGRCFHSSVVVGSGLYVFGGTVEFSQNARSAEMFRFNLTKTAPCTLGSDLLSLLESGELSDLELVVPGDRGGALRAHACVVAARSPALRQRILQTLRSSGAHSAAASGRRPTSIHDGGDNASPLEDERQRSAPIGGEAFGAPPATLVRLVLPEAPSLAAIAALLHFMYSDELTSEHVAISLSSSDLPRLLDICDCAGLYGVRRLEILCTQSIRRAASVDSVLDMLQVGRCDVGRDFLFWPAHGGCQPFVSSHAPSLFHPVLPSLSVSRTPHARTLFPLSSAAVTACESEKNGQPAGISSGVCRA